MRHKLIAGGLAALALIATTAAASAATAYATGNVNVRTGPGTYFPKVDTLHRGERVDVQHCQGSWCYVEKRGPDGWVSANYLSRGGNWHDDDDYWEPRPPRPPRPPHWNPDPWPYYPGNPHAQICFNGPHGYFCIGN
jgi:hypothetical protein